MDIGSTVISSLKWMAALRFLGQFFTWGVTIIVIRLLKPEDYGLMALAMVLVGLVNILNELGLGAAIVQKKEVDDELLAQAMGMLLVANLAFYVLLWFLAPLTANWFSEPELVGVLRVLSVAFLIMPFVSMPSALLARGMRFKRKSVADLVRNVLASLTMLLLAWYGFGVWTLVLGFVANQIFNAIALNVAAGRTVSPRFGIGKVAGLIGFSGWVTAARIASYAYGQSNKVVTGRVLGTAQAGLITVAGDVAAIPMMKIQGILNEVSFSALSRKQDDPEEFRYLYLRGIRVLALVAFPVFFGISAVASELVTVFLGDRWLDAILLMQILALAIPFRMFSNMLAPALMGAGHARTAFVNTCVGLLIVPVAALLGVSHGVVGVATAYALALPVVYAINAARSMKVLDISRRKYFSCLLRPLIAATVMLGLCLFVRNHPLFTLHDTIAGLIALAVVGALVYSSVVWVIARQDSRLVLSVIKK